MPTSYVDEVVVRWLKKKGYLVTQGIWFKLDKKKTKKTVAGWTDIDILAVKCGEKPLIVQCKSFIGGGKSTVVAKKISDWFESAICFLKKSEYSGWVNTGYEKVLVADFTVKKTEELFKKEGIKFWDYNYILEELFGILKKEFDNIPKGHIGKEEDILLRILSGMVRNEMISDDLWNRVGKKLKAKGVTPAAIDIAVKGVRKGKR